ncbi:MAG TPA: alpha-amylase family glycosyl hydrolase [Chitinophagaceae bacterium]|nr:alpha-amylase family glycosyl hydrolase [Chitinophagaceae bacterium]
MEKLLSAILINFVFILSTQAQLLNWTPGFPQDNSSITIIMDATKGNQGLKNYADSTDVYVHVGVLTNLSTSATDWRYVKTTWGTTAAIAKAEPLGNKKYRYIINDIRSFFGVPVNETIKTINILFRNGVGSIAQRNSDGSDMYIPVYSSALAVRLTLPLREPRYVPVPEPITKTVGETIDIKAFASAASDILLKFNGNVIQTALATDSIIASPTISSFGTQKIVVEATLSGNTVKDSIEFYVASTSTVAALPPNVQDGINYVSSDSVVLVLYAPNKSRASIIGEFNNWIEQTNYQMNITPDGKRYWLGIGKLVPGQEYAFQYLIDGTLRTGDPYSEKILDKNNDPFISSATYPGLKSFPTGATGNIVSILQTNQTPFTWTSSGYTRPDKKDLVIYELLLRDFLAASNWQTLTDTLTYLKNLGVNAIELMPFTEFEGNNSWGYNPFYFFAPDKAYGTKNALKTFIDEAHKKGLAVILDAVLNHTTGLSPLAQLYWDAANNRPAANNPWLNPAPTHPFNVFNDFNHESDATKYLVSRFIRYWLTEYKLDGFRWDLSKGFTQKNCLDNNLYPTDGAKLACWNSYDLNRVNIWQRYYDSMQVVSSGSYCILEHLGNDDEEADLAKRGMLLWGKMTDQYNENTMGYATSTANLNRAYWSNRSYWNDPALDDKPHLVVYSESHDEERTMYKNVTFGNSSGSYNVRDTLNALQREEAKAAFLLMMPGPKMLWQFEELGYDKSIFMCENGVVPQPYASDNPDTKYCKTNPKPPGWNYNNFATATARKKLYNVYAALNKLRNQFRGVFNSRTVSAGTSLGGLNKILILDSSSLKVVVIANFNVTAQSVSITFPVSGTWYSYLSGSTFEANGGIQTINLQPGEYYVYLNKNIPGGIVTSIRDINLSEKGFKIAVVPNPANDNAYVEYELPENGKVTITISNLLGQVIETVNQGFQLKGTQRFYFNKSHFAGKSFQSGNYFVQVRVNNKIGFTKFNMQR